MHTPVIVQAKRTATGKIGGMFKHIPPEKLGSSVINELIAQTAINPRDIDEVILGNAVGPGGNMGRLTALTAGLPVEIPGVTIDRQCGSGLEAIHTACRKIQAGAGHIYIAGGVESTSLAPWKLKKPDSLYEAPTLFTRARFSPEEIGDPEMGIGAENVADAYHVSREDQDRFAYESHQKALAARNDNRFADEIVPVQGKTQDECPRPGLSLKKLAKLRPIFKGQGSVTAGNACTMNDAAAAVLVMSEEKCRELGLPPILQFMDATSSGVDPNLPGIGAVPAIKKLLKRTNRTIEDMDLIEFNEAFASQTLASTRELGIPHDILNIGGGALALGHPYGASGAILLTRLCTEMPRTQAKHALTTLAIGGGLGLASLWRTP